MYQPGDRVWLRTTAGEMLARLIDPDAKSGVVIWLIEVEGGPRMLAREDFGQRTKPTWSSGEVMPSRRTYVIAAAMTLVLLGLTVAMYALIFSSLSDK